MAAGKRKTGRVFILLALVLILILAAAALLMRNQILGILIPQQAQVLPTSMPAQALQQIIVVAQPILRGEVITEAMLATVAYPQEEMVAGLFYTDMEQVLNKRTKFDLEPGTPLTPSLLTEAPSAASFQIPAGMVAISIPIDKLSSVSYALQPGDHVNIIGSILLVDIDQEFQSILPNDLALVQKSTGSGETLATNDLTLNITPPVVGRIYQDPSLVNEYIYLIPSEPQRSRLISQTLVQNAIVLMVGEAPIEVQTTEATGATPTPPAEATTAEVVRPDVVTLVVSPQDAIAINYLVESEAKITLVLRGAGDDQVNPTQPVTLQFIMDQYNIPYPSKLPYALEGSAAPTPVTPTYPTQ
jgi:pilus assembly protein CpaB